MTFVSLTLEGRTFRIGCAEEDAPRLGELAADLERRVASLQHEFGHVGEDRLVVMAALMALDELWDLRERADAQSFGGGRRPRRRNGGRASPDSDGSSEDAVAEDEVQRVA